ncbi:MAG: GlcG/HbpS family heme-binding protein [Methylovirgula sp.]
MRSGALGIVAGLIAAETGASAQTPAAAPPTAAPPAVPDKMPYDTPYGAPIDLAKAREVVGAVEAESAKRGWKESVAVVGPSGDLIVLETMDGSMAAAAPIAEGKARTSARFRRPSSAFFAVMETGHPYAATLDRSIVASPGGFPLIADGKLIGAVGCSGGTGSQDALVCAVGADKIK